MSSATLSCVCSSDTISDDPAAGSGLGACRGSARPENRPESSRKRIKPHSYTAAQARPQRRRQPAVRPEGARAWPPAPPAHPRPSPAGQRVAGSGIVGCRGAGPCSPGVARLGYRLKVEGVRLPGLRRAHQRRSREAQLPAQLRRAGKGKRGRCVSAAVSRRAAHPLRQRPRSAPPCRTTLSTNSPRVHFSVSRLTDMRADPHT